MKVVLDTKKIQIIDIFQKMTGATVLDCIDEDDEISLVVAEGQYGLAVGRSGSSIKNAEKVFKKSIRVFEYSADMKQFINNMLGDIDEMEVRDNFVYVRVRHSNRARAIGRNGRNIKMVNRFITRLFDIGGIKVR